MFSGHHLETQIKLLRFLHTPDLPLPVLTNTFRNFHKIIRQKFHFLLISVTMCARLYPAIQFVQPLPPILLNTIFFPVDEYTFVGFCFYYTRKTQ